MEDEPDSHSRLGTALFVVSGQLIFAHQSIFARNNKEIILVDLSATE